MNDSAVYKKRFAIFIWGVFVFIVTLIVLTKIDFNVDIKDLNASDRTFKNLAAAPITAKSVYILDLKEYEIVLERDATVERPLASITKIMSAIVALDLWPKTEIVEATLPRQSNEGISESLMIRESWQLQTLLQLMLTKSSNEAAESLVAHAKLQGIDFIDLMNKKSLELQLWNTKFYNASGLDLSSGVAGAVGTAEEVAYLLKYAFEKYPEIFETTALRGYNVMSEQGTVYFIENTNKVAEFLPGLIASKTGFTDLAGGNLAFAIKLDAERTVIVVLLGSTKDERFRDAEKITQALRADFNAK